MNKVKINNVSPNLGSIWISEDREYYILAAVEVEEYNFICLNDGERWCEDFSALKEANNQNLTLVAEEVKIEIIPV